MRELVAIMAFHGLGLQMFNLKGGKPFFYVRCRGCEGTPVEMSL